MFHKGRLSATRYHDISCGHRVFGHDGTCAHLHGHNYRIYFTVVARQADEVGRVLDFSTIKRILCDWLEQSWDHRFLIWWKDPLRESLKALDPTVVEVPFNPTAENMAVHLVNNIGPMYLPPGIILERVVVEETRKCSAAYELSKEI